MLPYVLKYRPKPYDGLWPCTGINLKSWFLCCPTTVWRHFYNGGIRGIPSVMIICKSFSSVKQKLRNTELFDFLKMPEKCNTKNLLNTLMYVLTLQVLLMLTSDLDNEEDKDKAALDTLLSTIIKELDLSGEVTFVYDYNCTWLCKTLTFLSIFCKREVRTNSTYLVFNFYPCVLVSLHYYKRYLHNSEFSPSSFIKKG